MSLEFAIVADTHWGSPNPDLERLVHRLQGADFVVHAGDVIDPSILTALESVAPVLAVLGNCCRSSLRGRLPLQRSEDLQGLKLGVLHGHLVDLDDPDAILGAFAPDVRVVVHGHSHVARKEVHGERWIFNPGSVSQPRYNLPPSYGWGTWRDGELTLMHRQF